MPMISINKNRRVHDSITKHSSVLAHLCPGPLEPAHIGNKASLPVAKINWHGHGTWDVLQISNLNYSLFNFFKTFLNGDKLYTLNCGF